MISLVQLRLNCYNHLTMENETVKETDKCPCCSGKSYGECCSPILSGKEKAKTAEALMRARYTAYVVHNIDFIINTCESGEKIAEIDRKATEDWSNKSVWHGLKVLRMIFSLIRDEKPLFYFTTITLILLIIAGIYFFPFFFKYFSTGYLLIIPTLIIISTVVIVATIIFFTGVILHVLKKQHADNLEHHLILLNELNREE